MYPNGLEKAIMMRCDNDSQFRSVAIFRRLYFCKRIRVSTGYGIAVLVLGRDCTLYVPIASILSTTAAAIDNLGKDSFHEFDDLCFILSDLSSSYTDHILRVDSK